MGTPPPLPLPPRPKSRLQKRKGREGVSPADEGPIQILFSPFWTLPSHTMMNGNSLGKKFFFAAGMKKRIGKLAAPTHFCAFVPLLSDCEGIVVLSALLDFCPRHLIFSLATLWSSCCCFLSSVQEKEPSRAKKIFDKRKLHNLALAVLI